MPYAYPADPSSSSATPSSSSAPTAATPLGRPGHRRTRSSFSDERGPGAFTSLGALPRRRPTSESGKRAVFHLSVDDDSPPDDDPSPAASPRPAASLNLPLNSLRLSIESGRFSPSVAPPAHIELPPKATLTPASPAPSPAPTSHVPFPTSSPLSPSPFLPDTPSLSRVPSTDTTSIPRTPSTPIILSNGRPLKPSLKSSSSSPNVVADFALARKHSRAQSAPSTPRVHFAERDADLATVRLFNRTGKPASVSKPAGEETETETEAEYPFPTLLSPGSFGAAMGSSSSSSGAASPSQLLHEVDTTPGITSPIPNPAPSATAHVLLETVTLPRTRPPTLRGTVLVRNVHFEKNVVVRFTLDDWQTTSEVGCRHVVSLPGLPPPFPRARTVGDVAGVIAEGEEGMAWDRFSFTIRLEDYEAKLSDRTLFLAARYVPANGALGEFWDNNTNANYRVGFRRILGPSTPLGSPLATPLAASASFPAGKRAAGFGGVPQVSTFGAARWASATSQQRTFSAPSSLRVTPVTGSRPAINRVAVAREDTPTPPLDTPTPPLDTPQEKEKGEGEGEEQAARVPLFRRHSAPHEPRFPVPPPIATTASSHKREPASASASPVERYISRRLSLSNYVAPGASPVVEKKVVVVEEKPKVEVKKEEGRGEGEKPREEEERTGIVTPPTTPPREALKGLPDVEKEEREDAQAMLSPLVMGEERMPFSPTATDATPWQSLEARLALSGLVSPPVSREGSAEGTPARSPSPSSLSPSPNPSTFSASNASSNASHLAPNRVSTPTLEVPGSKVDTNDSSYAAFIRQWCFAQSTPPAGATPSVGTAAPSPVPTPPPASVFVQPRRQGPWAGERPSYGFGYAEGGMGMQGIGKREVVSARH